MRSSATNVSSAPGGCPETCVVHESGWKSGIRAAKPRSMAGMSVTPGTSCRYSSSVVSLVTNRSQPSIIASANVHAVAVA